MDKIKIRGGKPLRGTVQISGAKNAALPILISSLLTDQECRYTNVPELQDIRTTMTLLHHLGCVSKLDLKSNRVSISAGAIRTKEAPYDLVRTMRASVLVLGPLLARFGEAKVSLPGGCAIGARPIQYHLHGLERLGAQITLDQGYVYARSKKLQGNRVAFEFPSVGATENVLMAATLAEGESLLENCAKEPEIVDLAKALRAMGAEIEGEGTEEIRVSGKPQLKGLDYAIMADRIEAGTFLAAGLATGGDVTVSGIDPLSLDSVLGRLEETGAKIVRNPTSVQLAYQGSIKAVDVTTLPFPGFPTDMQAQFMALMTMAKGASLITETIFENRFMHVSELTRLGADISIRGNTALVRGGAPLNGAQIMATDLRASASLVIAGLCASGETVVNRIYHLDRGYERMEEKLRGLGAEIERMK